jgi:hypothetical protein
MKPEERKKLWENMQEPKMDWETFKRMLPAFNNDIVKLRAKWLKKQK